jgi:hypothetical protein
METGSYDIVLLDLMMPDKLRHGSAARSARARCRYADLHDHRVWVGGSGGERAEARRERLFFEALGQRKAADRDRPDDRAARLERENTELKRALKQRYSFPNIIGKSERMLRILDW